MIVMAIIAILSTAGLSAYTGYIRKARDTARAEIARNLNTAIMSYVTSNGGNPPATNEAFNQFLASAGGSFVGT
jgi:type II secretory pathway pseudopilin PulG